MVEREKTALIMEGGAMRGMFTAGVIDVFMEQGIEFDAAAGISAGAVFGCNYKSRQIGRPLRYNKNYCRDPRYCSFRSLIKTGDLYGVDFCYRHLPENLDPFDTEAFMANPMKFYVGATDVLTGKPVYHLCTDGKKLDMLWMRASASMPMVSRPVEVEGKYLLDGGIADSVMFQFMEDQGYHRNVILLTQPAGYRKKKSSAMPLMRASLRKYPAIRDDLERRHTVYNKQMEEIEQRERDGSVFVIRPPYPLNIGRIERDPKEIERVYQIGRSEAMRVLEPMKNYLNRK